MTDIERLQMVKWMEHNIREFKIIVSGDADIQGGFGHLPRSDHLPTRVSNIEKSIDKFRIEANGFNVSGNFDDGFIFS